jgi:hypothetical protein
MKYLFQATFPRVSVVFIILFKVIDHPSFKVWTSAVDQKYAIFHCYWINVPHA